MIYTSYFAQLRNMPDNIIPISICAQVPNWYKGAQYKKVAPTYDIFMEWKTNKNNEQYIKQFKQNVLGNLQATDVINELYSLIGYENYDNDICLVCYEKSTDFCHRHLVAEWLRQNGIDCIEWEKIK